MKNPILLLHGALGAAESLKPLARSLQHERDVYTLDFPGHGGRGLNAPFSIPFFADDVLHFINDSGLKQVDVFGFSMGGYVALYLASLHPEHVGRIFTLGTKFDWSPEAAEHEIKMLDPEKVALKVPRFAEMLQQRHAPEDWRKVMAQTAQLMLDLGNHPLLTGAVLAKIEQPVHIAWGDQDNMVTLPESRAAADALPNGALMVLKNTPHPIEKVDLSTLEAFIGQK